MANDPVRDAGIETTGTKTTMSGPLERLERELAYGERVTIVIDAVVTGVGLAKGPNGPIVARKLTTVDGFELEGERGRGVLNALRLETRAAADTAGAREVLPGLELVGIDGAIVTPEEAIAVAHGDELPAAVELTAQDFEDALVLTAVPFLVDDAEEASWVIAELEAVELLRPYVLRAARSVEERGLHRGEVLDALDARIAVELERLATDEPWDGYAKATISDVVDRLHGTDDLGPNRPAYLGLLEHVAAFETAHKDRAGVADFVNGELLGIPDGPEPDPAAGDTPDETPDHGPEGAFPDVPDFEPDDEPDDELELDDDES